MRKLVVDASVVIKWVVDEPGTEEALLLRRHRLLAPELLIAECANILWKKVRRGEFTAHEASLAARLLERADIDLCPMRPHLDAALQLAVGMDHAAYDCAYLALAVQEGCDFVTADEQLLRKSLGQGLAVRVLSLSNAAHLPATAAS